ncbi:MAG: tRNA lysidine(34) synthetase TilS [Cytophagales bacterium]|nr:tRNA lysidine(34) synthetase TilS [Cytophagales bacterium]
MLSKFNDYISRYDLVGLRDRILLAVSGGLDSMVMLHLFQAAGYEVGVAHGNFGLRGKESDAEEEFVKQFCGDHEIVFYSKRFNTKNYAEEKKISTQMAARDLRYEWFNELLEQENYHWLATAHQLSDNLETVLLRWTSGSGLDQLVGIPRKNERIVRPMLFASRDEINAYAIASGITWKEDSSNTATHYQRNFIRHQVIPRLKELNPSLENTFAASAEKLEGAYEQMQRGMGQLRDTITRTEGRKLLVDKALLQLLKNPPFVCYELLRPYGFDLDRCRQLAASLDGQPGARFFSASHEAVVDREYVIVAPREEAFHEVFVEEGQDKAALGPWMLQVSARHGKEISGDAFCATVDRAKVRFPIVWRKWKSGDSFFPLGMTKRKKLSDFLIDERVALPDKGRVTVMESDGEIVWVAGYRVDDRYKVTGETRSVLEMKVRPI